MPADPATRLFDWVFRRTLPFWLARGLDRDGGGFHESLNPDCTPVTAGGKRAMVQARQIYTFSEAALLTQMPGARAAACTGVEFLAAHCRHPDGGWRFRVTRNGDALDDRRDLYTQAFVLFALAWRYRLTDGDPTPAQLAAVTIDYIERALAHPAGGYHEGLDPNGQPLPGWRRQNPHMHLLEACLAWHESTGERIWLDRARRIAALFRMRFAADGTLREFFDDSLAPADGDAGRHVEPGHHFEWIWLLHRLADATGTPGLAPPDEFYRFAVRAGLDRRSGGIVDIVDPAGAVRDGGRRIWPQTEAIKAHLSRMQAGDAAARGLLEAAIDALLRNHLDNAPEGAWREHLDANGTLRRNDLPASSLYHLTLAAAELARAGLVGA